jgi:hypothetical protein
MTPEAATERNTLRWKNLFWSLLILIVLESKSEALANPFFPHSNPRGGSLAAHKLLQTNGDFSGGAESSNHLLHPKAKRNGARANGALKQQQQERVNDEGHDEDDIGGVARAAADSLLKAKYIAETNLPTDVGHFRLRAYRTARRTGPYVGTEPCVIYAADKPPFGRSANELAMGVPVRVHDQCITSEVFRSKR